MNRATEPDLSYWKVEVSGALKDSGHGVKVTALGIQALDAESAIGIVCSQVMTSFGKGQLQLNVCSAVEGQKPEPPPDHEADKGPGLWDGDGPDGKSQGAGDGAEGDD